MLLSHCQWWFHTSSGMTAASLCFTRRAGGHPRQLTLVPVAALLSLLLLCSSPSLTLGVKPGVTDTDTVRYKDGSTAIFITGTDFVEGGTTFHLTSPGTITQPLTTTVIGTTMAIVTIAPFNEDQHNDKFKASATTAGGTSSYREVGQGFTNSGTCIAAPVNRAHL